MVSISTGSSNVTVSRPEFRSNEVKAVKAGGVVSGVKILTGTGFTLSTAGCAGVRDPALPDPRSVAMPEVYEM